jgi:anti-anti-sigma regulatory factor
MREGSSDLSIYLDAMAHLSGDAGADRSAVGDPAREATTGNTVVVSVLGDVDRDRRPGLLLLAHLLVATGFDDLEVSTEATESMDMGGARAIAEMVAAMRVRGANARFANPSQIETGSVTSKSPRQIPEAFLRKQPASGSPRSMITCCGRRDRVAQLPVPDLGRDLAFAADAGLRALSEGAGRT